MINFRQFIILLIALQIMSCQKKEKLIEVKDDVVFNSIVENSVDRDFDEIKKDGVLRALVVYSSTSYFLYRGETLVVCQLENSSIHRLPIQ